MTTLFFSQVLPLQNWCAASRMKSDGGKTQVIYLCKETDVLTFDHVLCNSGILYIDYNDFIVFLDCIYIRMLIICFLILRSY